MKYCKKGSKTQVGKPFHLDAESFAKLDYHSFMDKQLLECSLSVCRKLIVGSIHQHWLRVHINLQGTCHGEPGTEASSPAVFCFLLS